MPWWIDAMEVTMVREKDVVENRDGGSLILSAGRRVMLLQNWQN